MRNAFSQGNISLPKGLDLSMMFRNPRLQRTGDSVTGRPLSVGTEGYPSPAAETSQMPSVGLPQITPPGTPGEPMENPYSRMMASLWANEAGRSISPAKKRPWMELMK